MINSKEFMSKIKNQKNLQGVGFEPTSTEYK